MKALLDKIKAADISGLVGLLVMVLIMIVFAFIMRPGAPGWRGELDKPFLQIGGQIKLQSKEEKDMSKDSLKIAELYKQKMLKTIEQKNSWGKNELAHQVEVVWGETLLETLKTIDNNQTN